MVTIFVPVQIRHTVLAAKQNKPQMKNDTDDKLLQYQESCVAAKVSKKFSTQKLSLNQ